MCDDALISLRLFFCIASKIVMLMCLAKSYASFHNPDLMPSLSEETLGDSSICSRQEDKMDR